MWHFGRWEIRGRNNPAQNDNQWDRRWVSKILVEEAPHQKTREGISPHILRDVCSVNKQNDIFTLPCPDSLRRANWKMPYEDSCNLGKAHWLIGQGIFALILNGLLKSRLGREEVPKFCLHISDSLPQAALQCDFIQMWSYQKGIIDCVGYYIHWKGLLEFDLLKTIVCFEPGSVNRPGLQQGTFASLGSTPCDTQDAVKK